MEKLPVILILCLSLVLLAGCASANEEPSPTTKIPVPTAVEKTEAQSPTTAPTETVAAPKPFELTSPVLEAKNMIPTKYSCNGEDISVPLAWGDPPEGTQSFALIMDDPDAKAVAGFVWIHWITFNIPPETRSLAEDLPTTDSLPDSSFQGKNSFGNIGYGGPCPPSGMHHYYFKLYALDKMLNLSPGTTSGKLTLQMDGHILAQTELVTTYRNH